MTTPILISYATIEQNTTDLSQSDEAVDLMAQACQKAAERIQQNSILENIDRIYVPEGMWGYKDPAKLVADRIKADKATTVFAKIGITQQTLMAEACQRIADGEDELVLVSGGEAKFRGLQGKIQSQEVSETTQADECEADVVMQPDAELWLIEETTAGFGMPVSYYSAMDSAYRKSKGLSVDKHRDELAEIYHQFSISASNNPHAWKQAVVEAEYIRNASDKNPMLAFPYTKLHNTSWNVNQACAMLFTSEDKARELGIDEKYWIYPLASSENNTMLAVAERPEIHRSIGAEHSAEELLNYTQVNPNDITYMDLYSCFPAAVEIYADAIGVSDKSKFSCTGGMPFAGGPLNNYALQAACRVFELLDQDSDPNAIGLTSSVSGLITKQAFGLWSKSKPAQAYKWIDVSETVKAQEKPLTVIGGYHGEAVIVGYTVTYHANEPQRAIAICDLPDGKRTVSYSEDITVMQKLEADEYCGISVTIDDRIFSL